MEFFYPSQQRRRRARGRHRGGSGRRARAPGGVAYPSLSRSSRHHRSTHRARLDRRLGGGRPDHGDAAAAGHDGRPCARGAIAARLAGSDPRAVQADRDQRAPARAGRRGRGDRGRWTAPRRLDRGARRRPRPGRRRRRDAAPPASIRLRSPASPCRWKWGRGSRFSAAPINLDGLLTVRVTRVGERRDARARDRADAGSGARQAAGHPAARTLRATLYALRAVADRDRLVPDRQHDGDARGARRLLPLRAGAGGTGDLGRGDRGRQPPRHSRERCGLPRTSGDGGCGHLRQDRHADRRASSVLPACAGTRRRPQHA